MNAPIERITIPLGGAELSVPVPLLVDTFLQRYARDTTKAAEASTIHAAPAQALPQIGTYWPKQAGIYCGRIIDDDDRTYALIVARRGDFDIENVKWQDALDRASDLSMGGFDNWDLPTRGEALAMWQRLQPRLSGTADAFADTWYWTNESYAGEPQCAWGQGFLTGSQSHGHEFNPACRARAVRRLML